jgi:hypothetical protein
MKDTDLSILRTINKEIQDFQTKQGTIVQGLYFNQWDVIQRIFFYYNSQFQSGSIDDEGDRKYFYNIVKNPCKVYSKAIDFDTKNIRLLTAGGGDPLKTWFMERDLKYWMRDKQFGKVLNRIFYELPIFGSVVIKIIDGEPYFVDLRNFFIDQTADKLDDMNFITEVHNYTPAEFRKVAKQMKWKQSKVDEAIDKFHQMKEHSHIRLFERYGEVVEEDDSGMKYPYKRVFIADVGIDEYDNYGRVTVKHQGVQLASEEWEGHPYWEFHAEKIPGRWLGVGVVETLFEPQIKQNETANLESKSAYFLALRVFQTRDQAFNRNLKSNLRSGDVLNVDSEVTEVNIQDRNGAFFNEQTRKWQLNRDEMTFAYDAVQGERSPAGTPLGSTQISIGQTLSYFEGIQENVAMDIKEMLYEVILPQFEKDNNTKHTLRLVGKDLDQYIAMVKNELVAKEVVRRIVEKLGPFPTGQDKDVIEIAITESIKQEKEKMLDIPSGYYKGLKYDIDIDITGESVDTRVRSATYFAILQAIQSDPTMLEDERKRRLLGKIAEDGGVNLDEIFGIQQKTPETMMPEMQPSAGGGGVSAPVLSQAIQGETSATL